MINIIEMLQAKKSLKEVNEAVRKWNEDIWAYKLSDNEKNIIKTRVTTIVKYAKTVDLVIDDTSDMWDWDLNCLINGTYTSDLGVSDYRDKMVIVNKYAQSLGYDKSIPCYGPSIEYMRNVFWGIA